MLQLGHNSPFALQASDKVTEPAVGLIAVYAKRIWQPIGIQLEVPAQRIMQQSTSEHIHSMLQMAVVEDQIHLVC